jgi:DNA-binding transcriptional ArsR family regulator
MNTGSHASPVSRQPADRRRAHRPAADGAGTFHADRARIISLRGSLIAAPEVDALAETFKVLGDITRVRILDALSKSELCVCDIATLLGLTESAVSHQLRLLRSMRLVRTRRAGRRVFYALDDEHIIRLFQQGLRHVEEAEAGRRLPRASRAAAVPARGRGRS